MKVTPLTASTFRTDGGTMFGLVPKPMWSRLLPPDENNAIAQNANAALVQLDDGTRVLIDTGCGDPAGFSEKERALSGLSDRWLLRDALAQRGLGFGDIDAVVVPHLHWDHVGGCSYADGSLVFPHAEHVIHDLEWTTAFSGDPLLYKSYPARAVQPLQQLASGRLRRVTADDAEIFPGIRLVRTSGHTAGHCMVLLESDSLTLDHPQAAGFGPVRRIAMPSDVCPTQHHLRMVFQTSYDTYPLDTRRWKRAWLPQLSGEDAVLLFDHDADAFAAKIRPDDRKEYAVVKTLPAQ